VLVVDGDALEPVNLLNLVHKMLLEILRAAHIENLVRHGGTLAELLPLLDNVAFEYDDMLAKRNQMLLLDARLRILDQDAALATNARPEINNAVDLRNLRGVFRAPGLEQLGHTRQTAGDVLGLRSLARRLGQQ